MGDIYYYTKDDPSLLECVTRLSEAGVSDEELEVMIPEIVEAKERKIEVRGSAVASISGQAIKPDQEECINGINTYTSDMARVDMAITMERVLLNNNMILERGICDVVTDSVKKEMTYLLLAKDQVEEERYKRLDTLIRQQQQHRKETGKKSAGWFNKERFGFTG